MYDGMGKYEFSLPEEIEKEAASYRRGALITVCLLLLVTILGNYFLHS